MGSLKDQLLKAGLAPKKKAQKPKKKKAPTPPKNKRAKVGEATLRAQRAMLAKAKKDKKLNEQRVKDAEKKAKIAEIKQLIDKNKLERKDGETAYHFTFAKKVKKIYVTDEQQTLLSKGKIGIVTLGNDQYFLVPQEVANKILEREQNFVMHSKEQDQKADQSDEYADYQIPDDLNW